MTEQKLRQVRIKTEPIFRKYGILRAGVFGSFARNEDAKKSDIDFLVKYPDGITLFGISGLQIDLEKKLGKPVDLAQEGYVKKRIEPYIEKDLVQIYEKR